jgi:signal peptide peptidase SppA
MLFTQLLNDAPWAVLPDRLAAIEQLLRGPRTAPRSAAAATRSTRSDHGSIATLRLHGLLVPRASDFAEQHGLVGLEHFAQEFRAALADGSVSGILIDVDSPGGSVYGIAELADEIYRARGRRKPVLAVANSLAAAGAYWIASSAGEFYVKPGGEVGGIGVHDAHTEWSKALGKAGIGTTLIAAGKYKSDGKPFQPLSATARAAMQARVETYYGAMVGAIARNRRVDDATVRDGMGQGRLLDAERAKRTNMVDGIATVDEVRNKLIRYTAAGIVSRLTAAARAG